MSSRLSTRLPSASRSSASLLLREPLHEPAEDQGGQRLDPELERDEPRSERDVRLIALADQLEADEHGRLAGRIVALEQDLQDGEGHGEETHDPAQRSARRIRSSPERELMRGP